MFTSVGSVIGSGWLLGALNTIIPTAKAKTTLSRPSSCASA